MRAATATVSGGPIASLAPGITDNTTFTGEYVLQLDVETIFEDEMSREVNATATYRMALVAEGEPAAEKAAPAKEEPVLEEQATAPPSSVASNRACRPAKNPPVT